MKNIIIYLFLLNMCFSCQSVSSKNKNEIEVTLKADTLDTIILHSVPNDTLLQSSMFEITLASIIKESPYSSKSENDQYGQMCENVYSLIYESTNIGINRKIDLLLAFAFYQEKYIPAYWSLLLVKQEKGEKVIFDSSIYIAPIILYKNCPKVLLEKVKLNSHNIMPPIQYKSFYENTLMKINSNKVYSYQEISEYQDLLRSQILNETFRNRYKEVLSKVN